MPIPAPGTIIFQKLTGVSRTSLEERLENCKNHLRVNVISWAKNDNAALAIRKQGRRHPGKDAESEAGGKE